MNAGEEFYDPAEEPVWSDTCFYSLPPCAGLSVHTRSVPSLPPNSFSMVGLNQPPLGVDRAGMLLILPPPAVPGPGWETPPPLGPPEEIQAVTGLPGRVLASLDPPFPPVRQAKQASSRREGVSRLYSSVQLLSCVRLSATPWTAARQASLSITNSGVHPNSCPLSR